MVVNTTTIEVSSYVAKRRTLLCRDLDLSVETSEPSVEQVLARIIMKRWWVWFHSATFRATSPALVASQIAAKLKPLQNTMSN